MINIQIAGAGAGKTYGLAQQLVEFCNQSSTNKVIYSITFTNAAKNKIEEAVIEQLGVIPPNLEIETVHTFLLNEVIYPYSQYITGDIYDKASIVSLPQVPSHINYQINRLKKLKVIHSSKVFAIARKILDKSHSKNATRAKRLKVDNVILNIRSSIERIYLDEVQDLDTDALKAFSALGFEGLYIYMIGDPKQAIKYADDLTDFITHVSKEYPEKVNILEPNNISRRVPTEILNISNPFCYPEQQQKSLSKEIGELLYIESNHQSYDTFITSHIESESLVCIDKKTVKYSTHKKLNGTFDTRVADLIATSDHGRDPELMVKVAHIEFCEDVKAKGFDEAHRKLCRKYSIKLEPKEYMITKAYSESILSPDARYSVTSIDSVKGLDADTCIVILTPNFYKYFLQSGLTEANKFNKVWKLVYVALTRAKKQLFFVLDPDVLNGIDIGDIKTELERRGFTPY
jgi:hypothetical protein